MVDYWFKRMRVVGYEPIQVSVGPMTVAIAAHDVHAIRNIVANIRFALARMEAICYKIEQEQAEEVM